MVPKSMQLIDIYGFGYQPWYAFWWGKLLIVGCLAGCALLVIIAYRRGWFRKKLSFEQQLFLKLLQPERGPHDSEQKLRVAYFELTLILKKYVADRFNFELVDKSDVQIAEMLQSVLDASLYAMMQEFLQRTFQIKFAHEKVSQEMLLQDIDFVKKFIEQTRRQDA